MSIETVKEALSICIQVWNPSQALVQPAEKWEGPGSYAILLKTLDKSWVNTPVHAETRSLLALISMRIE